MTQFAVVAFPRTEAQEEIEAVRARFDPLAAFIAAHVTMVFPFASTIAADELRVHVVAAIAGTVPFRDGIASAPQVDGEYLFLDLAVGADTFSELHERSYRGVLASHRSPTHVYRPHITIGRATDPAELREAATEARLALPLTMDAIVDHVAIFRLDEAMRGEVQELIELHGGAQ